MRIIFASIAVASLLLTALSLRAAEGEPEKPLPNFTFIDEKPHYYLPDEDFTSLALEPCTGMVQVTVESRSKEVIIFRVDSGSGIVRDLATWESISNEEILGRRYAQITGAHGIEVVRLAE